jgi:porin
VIPSNKIAAATAAAAAALAVLAAAAPAAAQPAPDAATSAPPAAAAASPFALTAAYTADLLDNVAGGRRTGGGYIGLLKLSAAYDGAKTGHDGLKGMISVEDAHGAAFSAERVGALQAISSAEAQPPAARLYELWLQQDVLSGRAGVKLGLTDLNSVFDVQETAALFLNASHGLGAEIGDTGVNGPSAYPTPALAVSGFYHPAKDWSLQLGVFDAVAGDPAHRSAFLAVKLDGALLIGQIEKRFGDAGRVEVGAWTYTSAFPSLGRVAANGRPREVHGNGGVYGLVEGRLMGRSGDARGLSGWLRLGLANGDVNLVSSYLGAGLVYTGLIGGREKDQIGLAVARAGLGSRARQAGLGAGRDIGDAETDIEATYRFVATDWLSLQPDIQYVIRPNGDRGIPDALVVGLRLAFSYSR